MWYLIIEKQDIDKVIMLKRKKIINMSMLFKLSSYEEIISFTDELNAKLCSVHALE